MQACSPSAQLVDEGADCGTTVCEDPGNVKKRRRKIPWLVPAHSAAEPVRVRRRRRQKSAPDQGDVVVQSRPREEQVVSDQQPLPALLPKHRDMLGCLGHATQRLPKEMK